MTTWKLADPQLPWSCAIPSRRGMPCSRFLRTVRCSTTRYLALLHQFSATSIAHLSVYLPYSHAKKVAT